MQFSIVPNPPLPAEGIGFWQDLKEMLITASEILQANTVDSDSSDDSESAPSLADFPFDPDVATVNELIVGCQEVIDALQA